MVFVFDGSMEKIPNGTEETQFYRNVIQLTRSKRNHSHIHPLEYMYPQIVLTRIDKVEQSLIKKYGKMDDFEREQRLRETIDIKIESVVLALGVSRSSVHFIENYHTTGKYSHNNREYR